MRNSYRLILTNIFFLAIGLTLYYFTKNIEILGAIIATGISLSIGLRNSQAENDRIFKELFQEFNSKYQSKFNKELQKIVNTEISTEQEELIIDYLNFCAEEYLWYTKGRIPIKVWESWKNGMIYYLNSASINRIIQNEFKKKNSYYGLFEILEKELKITK
ncbi:hypothetical protein CW731_05450 [Polaribacter sp. ALD11]|uniref:hypothetical protein n=1 Tax=Polaribacter sp. ALD11 TaxID=2058137 RepID=UPI000C31564D|nr:hypothetical protein [Polaribacter sp. ALD11]AUC84772.1 hypothetical protein CW731_05450 [Polaribacter sp. ALD11]